MTDRDVSRHSNAYWSSAPNVLLSTLEVSPDGLASDEAERRLDRYGRNAIERGTRSVKLTLFLNQFRSPLVLILVFAAFVSIIVGEWTDASIVLAVVLGSTVLGFVQEYRSGHTWALDLSTLSAMSPNRFKRLLVIKLVTARCLNLVASLDMRDAPSVAI